MPRTHSQYSTANGFKRFTQYLTAETALLLSRHVHSPLSCRTQRGSAVWHPGPPAATVPVAPMQLLPSSIIRANTAGSSPTFAMNRSPLPARTSPFFSTCLPCVCPEPCPEPCLGKLNDRLLSNRPTSRNNGVFRFAPSNRPITTPRKGTESRLWCTVNDSTRPRPWCPNEMMHSNGMMRLVG